ncbi:hypothetical protein PENTCL1PPCAC_13322, partial [Pristionchus entomophagus]
AATGEMREERRTRLPALPQSLHSLLSCFFFLPLISPRHPLRLSLSSPIHQISSSSRIDKGRVVIHAVKFERHALRVHTTLPTMLHTRSTILPGLLRLELCARRSG